PLGGTTIRINGAFGVKVFIAPNADASSFNTLDTTNWQSWRQLYDSDTLMDLGALNTNRNTGNIFDFGWGKYSSVTHNVVGDSIYLVQLPGGVLKKFLVNALVFDTAFDIQYANIDNSAFTSVHIGKPGYSGKNFVYLNMVRNEVMDKEPAASQWDMLFLRYAASDAGQLPKPETGVWVNKGVQIEPAAPVDVTLNSYTGFTFESELNTIGWDWQIYDGQHGTYSVKDSLAYFVQTSGGELYKIVFTGFGGPETGVISFYKEWLASTTGIEAAAVSPGLKMFPVPANNELNIINTGAGSKLQVCDLSGRIVYSGSADNTLSRINTSQFAPGAYIVSLINNSNRQSALFTVAH
ncbi:MAG TPA: T9SS type A sorting domain-containing protein, partial [Chitinophagales bacterium]|nr:T9SS type A sorting domain-containing protein [Chitinophagales bacterium]